MFTVSYQYFPLHPLHADSIGNISANQTLLIDYFVVTQKRANDMQKSTNKHHSFIIIKKTSGYAMVVHGRPKTPKNTSFFGVTQPPGVVQPLYSTGHN